MSEVNDRLARAGRHLAVGERELDLASGEARLLRDLARRRRRARAGAAAAIGAVLLVAAGAYWRGRAPSTVAEAPRAPAQGLTLEDGSRVTLVEAADVQRVPAARAMDIVLRLRSGTARFDVTRRPDRTFRVLAGAVTVEVVGTSFTVRRVGDGATVTVERGRVSVVWENGQRYLDAAEEGRFPPEAVAPASAPAPSAPPPPAETTAVAPRRPPSQPGWRALARAGEHARAYEALGKAGRADVADEPGDLLAAADVARLSGHPAEARAPLRRILERHRSDPRAGLAAFTLGRVLLEETGDPRGAAEAFALARTLDPRSPLVEDAWAREVEALARAGATDEARARAAEYLQRFPDGAKARQVRHRAGLR